MSEIALNASFSLTFFFFIKVLRKKRRMISNVFACSLVKRRERFRRKYNVKQNFTEILAART